MPADERESAVNSTYTLERKQSVPRRLEEVFAFFSDAKNLEELTPAWMRFEIVTPAPLEMHCGAIIDYRLKWHGVPLRWRTKIVAWDPPHRFEDLQLKGPYRLWHHTHRFESDAGGTCITDHVRYRLPFGPLGRLVHTLTVQRNVEEIFAYRQAKIREMFGGDASHVEGR